MRKLVVGDIHGGYQPLMQVLERANFSPKDDMLISVGDIVDGWPQVREVVDYIIGLPHKMFIRGNHDQWFVDHIRTGQRMPGWTTQGGAATLASYDGGMPNVPNAHKQLFLASPSYWIDGKNLYVHGGLPPRIKGEGLKRRIDTDHPIAYSDEAVQWDREMIKRAYQIALKDADFTFGNWDHIFIGHTSTHYMGQKTPGFWGNVVATDTGGGWEGQLSVVDADTLEYWQSDYANTFYPNVRPRG